MLLHFLSRVSGMAMSACWLVGPPHAQTEIIKTKQTAVEWIAMKFGIAMRDHQGMNLVDFGDPLTFFSLHLIVY